MDNAARSFSLMVIVGTPALPQAPTTGQPVGNPAAVLEWRGQYGGDHDSGAQVLMHAGRWEGLWRSLGKETQALDFTKYFAVVAHAGQRSTGGFTLEFLEPAHQGDDLLIRWRVRGPAPGGYTTQAITQPWKVKAFPRTNGKVKLEQLKD